MNAAVWNIVLTVDIIGMIWAWHVEHVLKEYECNAPGLVSRCAAAEDETAMLSDACMLPLSHACTLYEMHHILYYMPA